MRPMPRRSMPEGNRIKPGEVRNPEGRNQYTYRREFEAAVDEMLREASDEKPERSRAAVLADKALALAEAGDTRVLGEVLARVWPKPASFQLEHSGRLVFDFASLAKRAREEGPE